MTTIDKQTSNQAQAHGHAMGESKQTRYTPPKLVTLVSTDRIEGKPFPTLGETGTVGAS